MMGRSKILMIVLILACNTFLGTPSPEEPDYPTPSTPIEPPSGSGTDIGNNCPRNTLNLGVCANVLNGLLGLNVGNPSVQPCCNLIQGLVAVEAAACLCTTIGTNILGVNLNVPLSVNLVLGLCGFQVTPGLQCP